MDALLSLPLNQIAIYLLAGAFVPAIITLFLPFLKIPAIRIAIATAVKALAAICMIPLQAIRGACYAAGKITSTFLTKRLGQFGRKLEDGLQEFIELAVLQPIFQVMGSDVEGFIRWLTFGQFWKGLDEDDKMSLLQIAAEKAVLIAEKKIVSSSNFAEDIAIDNVAKKELAITETRAAIGSIAGRISNKAIDIAIELAVKKLKKLRKIF